MREKKERAKVKVFPPHVMDCEYCGGPMVAAPRGSQNLACIQCGRVKYGGFGKISSKGGV